MLPEGEEDDEKRNAQLAELPEGLRAVAGDARELAVRSSRLAVVPVWVGELTRLESPSVLINQRAEPRQVGGRGRPARRSRHAARQLERPAVQHAITVIDHEHLERHGPQRVGHGLRVERALQRLAHSVLATSCVLNVPASASARPSSSRIKPAPGFRPIVTYAHSVFATEIGRASWRERV